MKKHLSIIIMLIFITLSISAQKIKDVLYLKNGSIIYGKLIEIADDQYKMQTSDGSLFIYSALDVEKFAKEYPFFDGRKAEGFGVSIEAGLLLGSQHTEYAAPFSFNVLGGVTSNTQNITSIGSGVEFFGRPFTPLFIEYKRILYDRKTSPFIFGRAGGVVPLGGEEKSTSLTYTYDNGPNHYKGGASFTFGIGISWAKEDYETNLSFGYRYAHTSYERTEYNRGNVTYTNTLNRLEIKFGYKF